MRVDKQWRYETAATVESVGRNDQERKHKILLTVARNERRSGMIISRAWIPNALTMGSLLCGFAALTLALEPASMIPNALWLLLIASWLDILDGGVARLLHVHSPFGQQLDSLADVVTFAVAPALLMYQFSLHLAGWPGFVASALFVGCGVSRLARYNTQGSHERRAHFTGMPIGISSIFAALIVYTLGPVYAWLATVLVLGVSVLMISTIPFPSPGQIIFRAPLMVRILLAGVWLVALLRFDTWILMPLSYFLYGILQNLAPALRPAILYPQGDAQ
jgi:CDP-diacylglycerol---serine O-phosphatidyltransferase